MFRCFPEDIATIQFALSNSSTLKHNGLKLTITGKTSDTITLKAEKIQDKAYFDSHAEAALKNYYVEAIEYLIKNPDDTATPEKIGYDWNNPDILVSGGIRLNDKNALAASSHKKSDSLFIIDYDGNITKHSKKKK
ncbi:MAG: hypothetical protein GY749_15260 [Desulfobacteraceae bacterium]|nr:hypothetical protein [Desulfobacteraceae bacterium]